MNDLIIQDYPSEEIDGHVLLQEAINEWSFLQVEGLFTEMSLLEIACT